jgi:phage-related tail protein
MGKHDAILDEKMKRPFATFMENTQKQLTEQAEKHAIQIYEMKQTTIEAQHLLISKTMATQPVNYHRAYAHFTAITKARDVLFDGQPDNWPAF